jgi:hypothetical protein
MGSLSRRESLKVTGIGVVGAAALVLNSKFSLITQVERLQRSLLPTPEIHPIASQSRLVGFAPSDNSSQTAYDMIRQMDIAPGVVNYFLTGTDEEAYKRLLPAMEWCKTNGIVPMISWGPATEDILGPKERVYLSQLAYTFNQIGPVFFRPYYEQNLINCFPWNAPNTSSKEFKRLWKDVYTLVKERSPQTKIVFSANTTGLWTFPIDARFPGSEYVDITGLDAYNRYSPNLFQIGHYIQPDLPPRELIGPDLYTLMRLAPDKPPPVITELNIQRDDRSAWLKESLEYSYGCGVRLVIFFQWDKSGQGAGETDWSFRQDTVTDMRRHFADTPWYIRNHARGTDGAQQVMRYLCAV